MATYFTTCLKIIILLISFAVLAASPTPDATGSQKNKGEKLKMTQEEWMRLQLEEHQKDLENMFDNLSLDDPFEVFSQMRERFLNNFDGADPFGFGLQQDWITLQDLEDYYLYKIDTKKIDKEKLEIKIQNGALDISAENNKQTSPNFHSTQRFKQSLSLPLGMKEEEVNIEEDGDHIVIKVPKKSKYLKDNSKKSLEENPKPGSNRLKKPQKFEL